MVEAERSVMRGFLEVQEKLSFIAEGLRTASDDAINGGDGRMNAMPVAGAARYLSELAKTLDTLVNG